MAMFCWPHGEGQCGRHCQRSAKCSGPLRSFWLFLCVTPIFPDLALLRTHNCDLFRSLSLGYRRHLDKKQSIENVGNWHPLGKPLANDWQCGDIKAQLPCLQLAQTLRCNLYSRAAAGSGWGWSVILCSSFFSSPFPFQFLSEALP